MSKTVTRLFRSFQPAHYDISISLDRPNMRFSGTVTIEGRKVGRPAERLTFHQKYLKVTKASIIAKDKKGTREVPVVRINHHKSFDEVRLHTDTMLYPGEYTITMEFESSITPGMTGIYPCFFKHDGKDDALIATQFESHHAREAFPCIDEPEAKATFDLSLITEKGITVLGNTPAKTTEDVDDDRIKTTFHTTPRMSSYLLAFVTGNLHSKSTRTNRGTDVSVWATVAQPLDALDFALDVSKRSIEFFEDYFDVPYPLAKADHVALPDFSSGAMENWGLITYRERVLLAYPGETSQSTREQIATVVAHETSHQWFGNLVTMRWWDDLWLNESFANMMEYQAVDAMFPDWQVWDTFIAAEGLSALRRDATPGVQPVKVGVNHPDEISTLFDPSIVYAKGGRLLYMLKSYIGDDAFRKGLSEYFTAHAYKNTEGTDLWKSLSASSGKDIGAFMDPWLQRPGFPVVAVGQNGADVAVTQRHFSDNPEAVDADRLWPTPLFATPDTTLPERLVDAQLTCRVDEQGFIRVNSGARGHYIVNYTNLEHRTAIVEQVRTGQLSNAERLMLLNDSSMLARAGHQSYGDTLQLLEAYGQESSDPVWDIISLIIGETRRFIDLDPALEDRIKAFIRKLIVKQYERLGWDERQDDSPADQKLRATIIGLGSYAEDPAITERALKAFAQYQDNPAGLSSEIRAIVFGVPIKQGDTDAFEYLLKLHDSTHNSDLKADISAALTATRSKEQAEKLLARLKDPKLVKPQDADRWLVYLMRNRYVRETAWDWMVAEWPWIEETYKNDKSYDYMPRYAAGGCNTREWAEKYKAFFEPKQDQIVLKRNILIGIEEIDNRIKWLERDLPAIQKFFA
ncbi:MAG TPA: M1 family metallopeptidase [Candidatus Saccharimonadales bacterium]|nr:M1 family metallopeptidase [Candidatus Saccharimonadales bacterium]